jgi:hypothetical protein
LFCNVADKLKSWKILENGGNQWRVENPPAGADPVPEDPDLEGSTSCFATSFGPCAKRQVVDLVKEGWLPTFLDTAPPIRFAEWYASRFDCGSVYDVTVTLLTQDKRVIDSPWKYHHQEEQWTGREWQKVEHVFENYGEGLRLIVVHHSGKDTQFWAGHYGSKMTGTLLKYAG